MKLNRAKCLFLGMVLLFLGFQARSVVSVTLTPNATRFVEVKLNGNNAGQSAAPQTSPASYNANPPGAQYLRGYRRVVTPPKWLGMVLLSAGAVLTAQALLIRS